MNIVTGNTLPQFVFDTDTVAHLHAKFEVTDAFANVGEDFSREDLDACATALVVQDFTNRLRNRPDDGVAQAPVLEKPSVRNMLSGMPKPYRLSAAALAVTAAVHFGPSAQATLGAATDRLAERAAECIVFGASQDAGAVERFVCGKSVLINPTPTAEELFELSEQLDGGVRYGFPNEYEINSELGINYEGNAVPVLPVEQGDR